MRVAALACSLFFCSAAFVCSAVMDDDVASTVIEFPSEDDVGHDPAKSPEVAAASSRGINRARSKKLTGQLAESGPLAIVAIIGRSSAVRWAKLPYLRPTSALFGLIRASRAAVQLGDINEGPWPDGCREELLGFVLMYSWQFVLDRTTQLPADSVRGQITRAIELDHGRVGSALGFCMYPIVASAACAHPIEIPPEIDLTSMSSAAFSLHITALVGDRQLRLRYVGHDHTVPDDMCDTAALSEVVDRWRDESSLSVSACSPIGWMTWRPVGDCMVRCTWPGDIVAVYKGEKRRVRLSPTKPPRALELLYLAQHLGVDRSGDAVRGQVPLAYTETEVFGQSSRWSMCVQQFHVMRMVNSVRAAAELKQVGRVRTSMNRHLKLALPVDHYFT